MGRTWKLHAHRAEVSIEPPTSEVRDKRKERITENIFLIYSISTCCSNLDFLLPIASFLEYIERPVLSKYNCYLDIIKWRKYTDKAHQTIFAQVLANGSKRKHYVSLNLRLLGSDFLICMTVLIHCIQCFASFFLFF